MSELEYVPLHEQYADALEELELSVFATIDPDDLYHADELRRLAEAFPEGNFVVLDDGRPIGMGLGLFVEFDFEHTDHSLADITGDDGVSNHSMDHPWYYGTDISVYPEYRGRGIGKQLYELRKDCVRRFNKRGIVAGGVIPGYADHIDDMSAQEYIDKVVAGELYDPTLTFQLENGFEARGALPGYLDDPSVGNNSVLIVWENPDYEPDANTTGAVVANIHDLFARLIPDPDQPEGVEGPWRYASMLDDAFEAGVWEAPIESWREDGYPVDEFVMIISGHLRLTADDGTVLDLRSGDLGYIPRGWAGVWEVVEPVRKAYVIKT